MQEQSALDVDPRLGQRLGDYVVVARVADGAMGRVYEGRHHQSRARVAIKVLHTEVANDAIAVERFKREYETARELSHPNIVRMIDFGTTPDGLSFLIMEFLEGEELGKLLRRGGAMAPARIVRLASQLGVALDYAHSFGVIHRDLKPDNIFLCRSDAGDVLRILDFGSVKLQMDTGPKLTAFGTTLGSPYYMSPEQAMGRTDVDQRTDVFALTAILYECLTGRVAFDAPNVAQILMRIINDHPPAPRQIAPALPPRTDDLIDRGLRKTKTERFASASALAAAVCDAYGLEAKPARWAETPTSEIERALAATTPPAAGAFVDSQAPKGSARKVAESSEPPVVPTSKAGVMIGVAVGALALVAVVISLLLR